MANAEGAVHRSERGDFLYCVTGDGKLWYTTSGDGADASTAWTAMPGGAGISGYTFKTVTVDQAGNVYLLMLKPVTTGGGADPTVTTPLFRADAGSWTVIYSVNLPVPLTGFNYGNTVADPLHVGTLYATYGGSVFPVVVNGNVATWTSVAAGLPGGDIDDLWASSVSNVRTDRSPITAWRS